MKTVKKVLSFLLIIALSLPLTAVLASCKMIKNAPKYLGFYALSNLTQYAQQYSFLDSSVMTLNEETPNEDEEEPNEDDDIIVHEPADCYVNPEEYFYLKIKLDNPEEDEILSITVNGKKYQSYQFIENSTSEEIIIKVSAEKTPGIHAYNLDAVKFVRGETIGSVSLKTRVNGKAIPTSVRVAVKANIYIDLFNGVKEGQDIYKEYNLTFVSGLVYHYLELSKTADSLSKTFTLYDDSNCIENSNGYVVLTIKHPVDDIVLFTQELTVGENIINISRSVYEDYIDYEYEERHEYGMPVVAKASCLRVFVEGCYDDYSPNTYHNLLKRTIRYSDFGFVIFVD